MVFGVQQGSVLGPLMRICYTAPLGNIAPRHRINVHSYADDIQLYIAFSPLLEDDNIQAVTHMCRRDTRMDEIIVMRAPHIKYYLSMPHIDLGNTIVPISTVANIGVYLMTP